MCYLLNFNKDLSFLYLDVKDNISCKKIFIKCIFINNC